MKFFDLHCDTIYECYHKNLGLRNNGLQIDYNKSQLSSHIQSYALWPSDNYVGDDAFDITKKLAETLIDRLKKESITQIKTKEDLIACENTLGGMMTIENCSAFNGNLENIKYFADLGVKIATITWNGENQLGYGVGTEDKGLKDFGKDAIKEMEANNIVLDISHAGIKLFEDVCENSTKPFIATHSNAKALCDNRRNLADWQFAEIKNRGGLVGINFYTEFLNPVEEKASCEDIFAHAEYFLSLGGENIVAMGSDFDGADMPKDLVGIEGIGNLYEVFLRHNYSEELIEKIFFYNAYNFIKETF